MAYDLSKIEYVKALKAPHWNKADIQVQVRVMIKLRDEIDVQNISIKLVSNESGFNQIDKRRLENYHKLWNIPPKTYELLQYFCWEKKPYKGHTRDVRRMFLTEMTEEEQFNIVRFLNENKLMIVSDILRGRGEFCAEWMLVIKKVGEIRYERILKSINEVMNFYWWGDIRITGRGSIKIWRITMQRKGGDWGRPSANMLQFKIDPIQIFEI